MKKSIFSYALGSLSCVSHLQWASLFMLLSSLKFFLSVDSTWIQPKDIKYKDALTCISNLGVVAPKYLCEYLLAGVDCLSLVSLFKLWIIWTFLLLGLGLLPWPNPELLSVLAPHSGMTFVPQFPGGPTAYVLCLRGSAFGGTSDWFAKQKMLQKFLSTITAC